jgi:adenylate cyclase
VVFICDVRGFTQRTTRMSQEGKVTELVNQLNEYFGVVVDTLQRNGATIDKYMGDAVLAVFGVPINRGMKVEVQAALNAILELKAAMQALNERWLAAGKDPWEQVMILSGGPVISGNIGCSSRMDFTVIGDTVNMASRLEGVAKQANCDIVISRTVAENASSEWGLLRLGEFEIRGQGSQEVFTMNGDQRYDGKSI